MRKKVTRAENSVPNRCWQDCDESMVEFHVERGEPGSEEDPATVLRFEANIL